MKNINGKICIKYIDEIINKICPLFFESLLFLFQANIGKYYQIYHVLMDKIKDIEDKLQGKPINVIKRIIYH